MNVDNVYISCLEHLCTTKYRRRFSPFLWGVDSGYPQFPPMEFLTFRHFVNIHVDNSTGYPRVTHSFCLTFPQSYPPLWKTTCV